MKARAHLQVGGKNYHVVAAVLMMLGLIESYLHYQEVVPVFTGEVAHRIVELLKVWHILSYLLYKPCRCSADTRGISSSSPYWLAHLPSGFRHQAHPNVVSAAGVKGGLHHCRFLIPGRASWCWALARWQQQA